MFQALSRTLDLLLSPLFWGLLLLALTVWLAHRGKARAASRAGLLALLSLYLPASGFLAQRLFSYTERFEAPPIREGKVYDAAIVLGGFAHRGPRGKVELNESGDRLLRSWELLQHGRARRLVIVAGSKAQVVEADLAMQLLIEAGIDRSRILLGRTSLNTRENALEARDIVRREGLTSLVLITSAFHMQRAYECFRAVGLSPDVLATDHQAPRAKSLFEALAPRAMNLALSERALRELAGRSVYRLRGYAKP